MFASDYSVKFHKLFGNNNASSSSSKEQALASHRLNSAFRSASVSNEPQRENSISKTVWKYKPLPIRRLSMASRSPSCCSTASEAESITESVTSGKSDFRSASPNSNFAMNQRKGPSTYGGSSSFVMGSRRQILKPASGRRDMEGTSAQLSARISEFLQRTDHVMDEWRRLGHREPLELKSVKRSSSVNNIMIRGFNYWGRDSSKSVCSTSCDVLSETDEVTSLQSYQHSAIRHSLKNK